MCTFLLRRSKEQICLLCTKVVTKKDFKRKLTKACLNLELMAGKEIVAKVDKHFVSKLRRQKRNRRSKDSS